MDTRKGHKNLPYVTSIFDELRGVTYTKRQPINYSTDCPAFAWQRPTLTGTCVPTTIGAEKLNFRVRYGNGCDLLAIATRLFN